MYFLGNLGIDIKLLIAQLINFAILLWLLTKFLYKPIINKIEEDELKLNQVHTDTKAFDQERQELDKQKIEAKKQAREIIKEAEEIGEKTKERIQKEAEEEKQAVIKQIKSRLLEIENDKNKQ